MRWEKMDYYKRKMMAQKDIMQLLESHAETPISALQFLVGEKYGFNKKFVLEYITLLTENDLFEFNERLGFVINKNKEKKQDKGEVKNELS